MVMILGPDGVGVEPPRPAPPPPSPPPPPPAAQVSAAYQVLTHHLQGQAVNARTLGAALQAGAAYPSLSRQALAQAALLVQAQYDAQRRTAHQSPPSDAYAQAARELAPLRGAQHQPLFDPTVLSQATAAMSAGQLAIVPHRSVASYDAPLTCTRQDPNPHPLPPLPPGQSAPTVNQAQAQIQSYLQGGMSLQAAIGAARVQYGASPANEPTLAEAALATQAPAQLGAYQQAPQGGDPVQRAAQQIAALRVFAPATLAQATRTMTVPLSVPLSVPPSAAPLQARPAQAALATLEHDRAAHASPATLAADMRAYRTVLIQQMDAATGEHGSAWFNDPTRIDAWLQGEAVIADTDLQPQACAAQGHAVNSSAQQALSGAEQDLNLALGEAQTLANVTNTQAPPQAGDTPTAAAQRQNLAQTQRLTADLQALGLLDANLRPVPDSAANPQAQAEYRDLLADPAIQRLESSAQRAVIGAAGPGNAHEPQAQAEQALRQSSSLLSEYQGTVFYAPILAAAEHSAPLQARFNDLGTLKPGSAPDVLHAEAQLFSTIAVPDDTDLSDALYQQKYQSQVQYAVAHDAWKVPSGLDIVSKLQAPRYYADVSNLYAALGGKSTSAGQALGQVVMQRMNGSDFVGYSYYGTLSPNGKDQTIKSYYLNWINGQDGNPQGNYQLYQDIADTDPNRDTVRFIDAQLPGTLQGPAAPAPGAPGFERPGATLAPGGTVTLSSRAALLNTLGRAYGQTPLANAPANGAQYDGRAVVYGKTTLNALVDATLASQHLTDLSPQTPLVLTLTSLAYWAQGQDLQQDAPLQLWLEQTEGSAGQRYLGPAGLAAHSSYQAWLAHSGFGPGTLLTQPEAVVDARGQQRVNWVQTEIAAPQAPESWEQRTLHVGEVALTVGAVAVTTLVAPEADGLLLPLLYDAAQTYFAVSGALGISASVKHLWQDPGSWQNWVGSGMTIAADALTGGSVLGHLGLARPADLLTRGLLAGHALEAGEHVSAGARLLARTLDNTAGARAWQALESPARGSVVNTLQVGLSWTQRGAALSNAVLLGAQAVQLGTAVAQGRPVSAGALIQFVSTVGMGQFGKVLGWQHLTSLADLRAGAPDAPNAANALDSHGSEQHEPPPDQARWALPQREPPYYGVVTTATEVKLAAASDGMSGTSGMSEMSGMSGTPAAPSPSKVGRHIAELAPEERAAVEQEIADFLGAHADSTHTGMLLSASTATPDALQATGIVVLRQEARNSLTALRAQAVHSAPASSPIIYVLPKGNLRVATIDPLAPAPGTVSAPPTPPVPLPQRSQDDLPYLAPKPLQPWQSVLGWITVDASADPHAAPAFTLNESFDGGLGFLPSQYTTDTGTLPPMGPNHDFLNPEAPGRAYFAANFPDGVADLAGGDPGKSQATLPRLPNVTTVNVHGNGKYFAIPLEYLQADQFAGLRQYGKRSADGTAIPVTGTVAARVLRTLPGYSPDKEIHVFVCYGALGHAFDMGELLRPGEGNVPALQEMADELGATVYGYDGVVLTYGIGAPDAPYQALTLYDPRGPAHRFRPSLPLEPPHLVLGPGPGGGASRAPEPTASAAPTTEPAPAPVTGATAIPWPPAAGIRTATLRLGHIVDAHRAVAAPGVVLGTHEIFIRTDLEQQLKAGPDLIVLDAPEPGPHMHAFAQNLANVAAMEVAYAQADGDAGEKLKATPAPEAQTARTIECDGARVFMVDAHGGRQEIAPAQIQQHLTRRLGAGRRKTVFQFYDKAVAIFRPDGAAPQTQEAGEAQETGSAPPSPQWRATAERETLDAYRQAGLDMLEAHGPYDICGQPALIYERGGRSLKDINTLQMTHDSDGNLEITHVVDDTLLNETTLRSVHAQRAALERILSGATAAARGAQGYKVRDVQGMVMLDGSVKFADPEVIFVNPEDPAQEQTQPYRFGREFAILESAQAAAEAKLARQNAAENRPAPRAPIADEPGPGAQTMQSATWHRAQHPPQA